MIMGSQRREDSLARILGATPTASFNSVWSIILRTSGGSGVRQQPMLGDRAVPEQCLVADDPRTTRDLPPDQYAHPCETKGT